MPARVVVEHIMGTAISIDARDDFAIARDFDRCFAGLREIDERFSTFRSDSEVSRFADGRLPIGDVSDDLAEVLQLCESVRLQSEGAFDVAVASPKRGFDPSGLVKGWAVDRATALLEAAEWRNFCINAGGDIVTRGQPTPGRAWRIGIRHPEHADKFATVVLLSDMAIATSGAYERGDHIVDPLTTDVPGELRSVSVMGPNLTLTDAYATAAFVKGRDGVSWIAGMPGYAAFAATADNRAIWTESCGKLLADGQGCDG